ncbi:MAG: chemotaxis protein CheY [Dehalococcoidia bacterium]|nr:chemotaxis protein CheY [Dehalococcoidia bacterium]
MDETMRKKVLIVDDEPGVRRLVRQILFRDYTVAEAQNGEEAVDMARSQKPDIILMDMMMPKMDGLAACCAIKAGQITKGIPVVMLTAISHDLNKKLAENVMGADGYITKPFKPQDLLSAIDRLLKKGDARIPTRE